MSRELSRRGFIAVSASAASGFLLRYSTLRGLAQSSNRKLLQPNLYVEIEPSGIVRLQSINAEMGQGTLTVLAQLLAEELDVAWESVRVERAEWRAEFPRMLTEGSFGTVRFWEALRIVGASAREMLVAAAAKQWGVSRAECSTKDGLILHAGTGRTLAYGALAAAAAKLPVPEKPALKPASQYRYIGKPMPRVDTVEKVHAKAEYGIDVRVPGMLYAALSQAPAFGTHLVSVDERPARAMPGVHAVVRLKYAVAVVADTYWHARKGLAALKPQFSAPPRAVSDASIRAALHYALAKPGQAEGPAPDSTGPVISHTKLRRGDVKSAFASAAKKIAATYDFPYLAHATMEPMNCTAAYDGQTCEIWAPTQNLSAAHAEAVRLTRLQPDRVEAHATFMGGGFGRRSNVDYAAFAVEIAMAVRRPVKVIWSREEDIRHDHYRPAGAVRIDAGIDSRGDLIAWNYHVATPSVNALYSPKSKLIDWAAEENANDRPYNVPNMRLQWSRIEFPIPIWTWRSVGSSINAFASEAMLDEVAAAAGSDPFEYRRKLLAQSPRELAVLDAAAQRASWGKVADGIHQGIALSALRGSVLTHVVDIRMKDKVVTIERITCAVDCGIAVNPKIVESQIAGGTIFGLTAALWGKISISNGAVVEGNFDTYPMLRINQTPPIDVVIVESSLSPQGIGETGVAGIAPALVNAIASATGKRIRRLPLSESGITLAS